MSMEVRGLKSAKARIESTEKRAKDFRPVWPRVEAYLRDEFARQFTTEGAALGDPWEPLDARYAAQKAAEGLWDVLVETGGLRASYLGHGRWAVSEHRPQALTVGSKAPHAHLHHRGTKGGQMPARPVLKVTRRMRKEVARIIHDYLLNG